MLKNQPVTYSLTKNSSEHFTLNYENCLRNRACIYLSAVFFIHANGKLIIILSIFTEICRSFNAL